MIINKENKLEKIVSKDDPRIQNITFEDGKLYATNGSALAVVAPQMYADDHDGGFSIEALKEARRAKTDITLNGKVTLGDGRTYPICEKHQTDYKERMKDWKKEETTLEIGIDAKLLYNLSQALGSDKLVLSFSTSKSPILVKPIYPHSENEGIIMPCNRG